MFSELRKQYSIKYKHKDEEQNNIKEAIYRRDLSQKQCSDLYMKFQYFLKKNITNKEPVIYKRGKSEYIRYVERIINFVNEDQFNTGLVKLDSDSSINVGYIYMVDSINHITSSPSNIIIPSEIIMVSVRKNKDFDIVITDPRIWTAFSECTVDKKFEYVKDLIYS